MATPKKRHANTTRECLSVRTTVIAVDLEYQHYDVGSKNAFCFNPSCNPGTGWDEDLSAKGDLVRARLTIKTAGYRFFY